MVLTREQLLSATVKSQTDSRIRSALFTRQNTVNFSEQAACDREIQRYLSQKGTIAYKFNCCIVHQPWRFNEFSALSDHGWDDSGPTDERLCSIYYTLPFYSSYGRRTTANPLNGGINDLNRTTNMQMNGSPNNFVYEYNSRDKPGWAARLLSCIFA